MATIQNGVDLIINWLAWPSGKALDLYTTSRNQESAGSIPAVSISLFFFFAPSFPVTF